MEIRRARREPAQNRSFQAADVLAQAADHGLAGVGDRVDRAGQRTLRAGQREHRQSRNVEDRRLIGAGVGNADVERHLDRMVAHVGRVVAGAAKSRNAREVKIVIEARNPGDVDRRVVEHLLAARDRLALATSAVARAGASHGRYRSKICEVNGSAGWILPERIVHADVEIRQLQRQRNRSAGAAVGGEVARLIVEGLGGEYAALECDDLGQLRGGRRRTALA